MSYPYPQDRHRDRKEKGDQPYKDAKEAMTETDVKLENQVAAQNAPDDGPPEVDERSDEMADRLRRVNEDIQQRNREDSSSTGDQG